MLPFHRTAQHSQFYNCGRYSLCGYRCNGCTFTVYQHNTHNRTCVFPLFWNTFQLGWLVFSCPFTHSTGILQNHAMSCLVKWSRCLAYSIVTYDGELCGKFALGFNPSPFGILVPAASLLGGFLGNSVFSFKLHCQDSVKFLYPWNCQLRILCMSYRFFSYVS